ncbi:dipeptidyl peptidase 4 like protein [Verticillium longisporum]|nr:dipeptidyl peptidase 4 like protein [Verticillium longisporum]
MSGLRILEYITYTVDNRGTGWKGRGFRATVASHLGRLEPLDQIWAAEQLIAEYDFIDTEHISIFGWSYGGFLAAKTLEENSGVFTSGLIVAPVTDWRFYDSMYTERYMKTSQMNPDGYNETAVTDTTGFKNLAGKAYIAHGTGDDNVHYQNTAALVDLLVGSAVPHAKFNWHAFTDSDHSIVYNGAGAFIYKQYCFLAYAALRKSSNLILNLFSLMVDANIPDIRFEPDKAVLKVRERFHLELSEEEAIRYFDRVIEDTLGAIAPVVIDKLHELVQAFRN